MEEENTSCDDDDLLINNSIIPQDVLIHILVLLPVISLLRFKSVCKSWCALIQSSFFIDLHLNTTNNNNFGTFIYQTSDYYSPSMEDKITKAFMLSAGGGGGGDDEEFEKLLKLEDLGFPPRYKFYSAKTYADDDDDIFMVGSCNGLICIHDSNRREVSLWNPATRQFRLLPESITPLEAAGIPGDLDEDYIMPRDFVAFGYDVKNNDYKVVLISYFRPHNNMSDEEDMSDEDTLGVWLKECIFRVQVYSFTTDSWKLLEGINSLPALPRQRQTNGCNSGVYLKKNGSYYFLGTYLIDSKPTHMLLSFDFTKEIFTTIQLPHDYHLTTILTSFGEKQLALFARMPDESNFVPYDLWVLNEHHGVKEEEEEEEEEESWTKLHSIRLDKFGNYIRGVPISISNNGEFALIYSQGDILINGVYVSNGCFLQLFNLVTQEVKKEFRTGTVIRAKVYKQSLVSIGGNDSTADRVIGAEM